jgi:aminotransferase
VSVRPSERVARLEPSIIREMSGRRRPTSIDLSLGEPRLTPDEAVLERAWRKLRGGPQGYTPNAGLPELRARIGAHYAIPGRDTAEHVVVTVGSEQAVFLALTAALDPGDAVLVPDPGYPAYRGIARLIGAEPIPYPVERATGLLPRAAALEARLRPGVRAVVLNSPSNPFGTLDEAAELAAIARLAEAHDLVIISDEIYRELWYETPPAPSIATLSDRVILVNGLSKNCAMTGLRLGFMIADAALVKKATLAHQLMVTCAPRLAQLVAIEVFDAPELLRAQVPFYAEARKAIERVAPTLPAPARVHLGGGAFYTVLDVEAWAGGDPLALAIALLEQEDVVSVPGTAFGAEGAWFLRLSYAAGADAIEEGLGRIARFLASRPPLG